MMNFFNIIVLFGVLMVSSVALAEIIFIPDDYQTIKEGVNAAEAGDTVMVRPGLYYERAIHPSRNITLISSDGPLLTIIDGTDQIGPIMYVGDAIVDGFTIRNGIGESGLTPGGVSVSGSNATVKNCWILDNEGTTDGGGIRCIGDECNALLINNVIANNRCFWSLVGEEGAVGAGIMVTGNASVQIINNTIVGNISNSHEEPGFTPGRGGGIYLGWGTGLIANNIITDNIADLCPAILFDERTELANNNIWNNSGEDICDPGSYLSEDPLFVSGPLGDFYLSQIASGQEIDSPCTNHGNNSAVFWGLDSLTTRTDGVNDEGVVDIGYHYQVPAGVIITNISANQSVYEAGDDIIVTLNIINPGEEQQTQIFVVLDIAQNYWFWPSWSETVDYDERSLPESRTTNETILNGVWPEENVTGSARIWAGLLNPETSEMLGNYDYCSIEF